MASTKISYFGKKVLIGIDLHKQTYSVTSICDGIIVKKVASVPANPAQIAQSILLWFKGAEIYTAYEAGFSGFGLHRELEKASIKSIVVNAASIAVASNDKVKTNLRDSKKIAEQLSTQRLKAIQIPSESEQAINALTRGREQVVELRATVSRQIISKLQ